MRTIDVSRDIPAPRSAVWAVLADYPNIADWNTGIKTSYSTGDATEGVGAKRHCDLAPMGELEETIAEWQPEERLVINIDTAKKLPIKHGVATFTLEADGDTTTTGISYAYEPGYGPIGRLISGSLDKQLAKGFDGFLVDLRVAGPR
ncbi:MAG: SRPBCC family protein [Ilumatobacteraceae bacterium]